jgi:hypothetical protein
LFYSIGDGWLDLFVGYDSIPQIKQVHPCELFRNNGDGTFTECAEENGVAFVEFVKGVASGDYNNDGRPDLYISSRGFPNRLLRNDGPAGADASPGAPWRFTDVARTAGVAEPLQSFPCWFFDYDNDGWLDFYIGTGDPYLGTLIPNRMFRNENGRWFQDVTTSGGFGQLQKGHSVAFADINEDGEQDIYEVIGGVYSGDHYHNQLFANPGHGNHWLKLTLTGVQSNRLAVGARVKVLVQTPDGPRAIHRVVSTGSSFGSAPFRQEIGLGPATQILQVEIFWPATGKTQVVENLAADHAYAVTEGESAAKEVVLRRFPWPAGGAAHQHHHHADAAGH